MSLLLTGLLLWTGSAIAALFFPNRPRLSALAGSSGMIAGSAAVLWNALSVLRGAAPVYFNLSHGLPFTRFSLHLDALSAWFVLIIALLSALTSIYAIRYLDSFKNRSHGPIWFWQNLLTISMALVVLASDAMLFLIAWEIMALSSFFLVMLEDEKAKVRRAGWIYLAATHIGTLFLFLFFFIFSVRTGSMNFSDWPDSVMNHSLLSNLLFIFAVIGFGSKAGFMPMHVWLPEAHPVAPSHVSALLSGVMIKTGIYGLLRTLPFIGPPPLGWGLALIGIGLVSGILGVLYALAQHDIKRLLAYHSIENIGIITLGMGTGFLGLSIHSQPLTILGFSGALLHVLNHALFKELLFMSAGSVLHATGTRDIDHMGGLIKTMPWTAVSFAVGSAAICGLPPFNGFISEFLIFCGAFKASSESSVTAFAGWLVIGGLAMIGGLALACFTKVFGISFLGESRSESSHSHAAHECGPSMRWPMIVLAAICLFVGLFPAWIFSLLIPVLTGLAGQPLEGYQNVLGNTSQNLEQISHVSLILIALVLLFSGARHLLLAVRKPSSSVTWDCGFAKPGPRMQYTASSYASPIIGMFHRILGYQERGGVPGAALPGNACWKSISRDIFMNRFFIPVYFFMRRVSGVFLNIQQGKVQLYILYIAVTLIALLIWGLR